MQPWIDVLEVLITVLPLVGVVFSLLAIQEGHQDLVWLQRLHQNGLRRLVARNHLHGEYVRLAGHLTGVVLGGIFAFGLLTDFGGSNEFRMLAIRGALVLLMLLTSGNSLRGWRARRQLLRAIEAHDSWDHATERRGTS